VRYEIGGQQLTEYWFYAGRRWEFDLVLSNPDVVKLYRMSPSQYASAVGCAHQARPPGCDQPPQYLKFSFLRHIGGCQAAWPDRRVVRCLYARYGKREGAADG
jgi:hypothetical protein